LTRFALRLSIAGKERGREILSSAEHFEPQVGVDPGRAIEFFQFLRDQKGRVFEPQEGSIVTSALGRFAILLNAVLIAGIVVDLSGTGAALAGYFPERPSGPISTMSGILESYDIGNDAGGFSILSHGREVRFRAGALMKLNGQITACSFAPTKRYQPPPSCHWPPNIILGKSLVIVHYWRTIAKVDRANGFGPSSPRYASDEIDAAR